MKTTLLVGTYERYGGRGIYRIDVDLQHGSFGDALCVAPCKDPTFLIRHPHHQVVYATHEAMEYAGQPGGAISTFRVNPDRTLAFCSARSTIHGACVHGSVSPSGRFLAVANYCGPSAIGFRLSADGEILDDNSAFTEFGAASLANSERQDASHPHAAVIDPSERWVYVPDLGADQLVVCAAEPSTGALKLKHRIGVSRGAGPRHLACDPARSHVYLVCELDSTLIAYQADANTGMLKELRTLSTRAQAVASANLAAAIALHPNGRVLYVSNRGDDDIAAFDLESDRAGPVPLDRFPLPGRTPRHFALDSTGQWLAVAQQDSGSVALLAIGPDGRLTSVAASCSVPGPACVCWMDT